MIFHQILMSRKEFKKKKKTIEVVETGGQAVIFVNNSFLHMYCTSCGELTKI